MKRKPKKGQALVLWCRPKTSSSKFPIAVTCVGALDRDDGIPGKLPAEKCPVYVRLPDGSTVDVTRGDVEPATEVAPVVPAVAPPSGKVVLDALEKEPEGRLKTWRDADSSFHRVCARYELGRRAGKGVTVKKRERTDPDAVSIKAQDE